MKKQLSAIVVSTLLVGCATPESLRNGAADASFDSQKTAKKVAICIAEKWEEHTLGTWAGTFRERENGYVVMQVCGLVNACILADVSETETGSNTKIRSRALGVSAYIQAAQDCQ